MRQGILRSDAERHPIPSALDVQGHRPHPRCPRDKVLSVLRFGHRCGQARRLHPLGRRHGHLGLGRGSPRDQEAPPGGARFRALLLSRFQGRHPPSCNLSRRGSRRRAARQDGAVHRSVPHRGLSRGTLQAGPLQYDDLGGAHLRHCPGPRRTALAVSRHALDPEDVQEGRFGSRRGRLRSQDDIYDRVQERDIPYRMLREAGGARVRGHHLLSSGEERRAPDSHLRGLHDPSSGGQAHRSEGIPPERAEGLHPG